MLYDAYNRTISETRPPPAGQLVHWEPGDRLNSDVSTALTPSMVGSMMVSANSGDVEDQCRLALEIEEKNWDISHAVGTRRAAIAGLEWEVQPGDDSARAKTIAAEFEAMLREPHAENRFDTFEEAIVYELMGALLPGFAVVEIIWGPGGKVVEGFAGIEQRHFTFRDSREPLLVTSQQSAGVPLAPNKFLYHRYRARSGDATRGGLIRPLAWLHVFETLAGMKDLLRFIERYGMPFLVTKVSQEAWERDRNRLKYLIQNFGSNGGAVFTDAVEVELLQAANVDGEIFFRLLDYCGAAITKVVLGQTASSGDAAGLSKGQTQENVRQDLLEMDCKAIDATLSAQLARPWTLFRHGPNAPVPRVKHKYEPPEDKKEEATVIEILNRAGYHPTDEEIEEKFGYKLKAAPAAPPPPPAAPVPAPKPGKDTEDTAAMAAEGALGRAEDVADGALAEFLGGAGLSDWFAPLSVAIGAALRGDPDEAEFRQRVIALTTDLPGLYERMDSAAFEDVLSRTIYTAAARGKALRAAQLARKGRG